MSNEFELAELRAEIERLKEENEDLRAEVDDLRREADLDACHIAGLAAQIKALIAEGDACPSKAAHPLLVRGEYTNAMTGEAMTKTAAYPLYREAFDAEARELGFESPENLRA
jgi:cell division septum initiation protein DivIVA